MIFSRRQAMFMFASICGVLMISACAMNGDRIKYFKEEPQVISGDFVVGKTKLNEVLNAFGEPAFDSKISEIRKLDYQFYTQNMYEDTRKNVIINIKITDGDGVERTLLYDMRRPITLQVFLAFKNNIFSGFMIPGASYNY